MKTCCRRSKQLTTRRPYQFCFFAITISALLLTTIPPSNADTFRPVVRGRRGVVAGGHPLSVEAGLGGLHHAGDGGGAGVASMLVALCVLGSPFIARSGGFAA